MNATALYFRNTFQDTMSCLYLISSWGLLIPTPIAILSSPIWLPLFGSIFDINIKIIPEAFHWVIVAAIILRNEIKNNIPLSRRIEIN